MKLGSLFDGSGGFPLAGSLCGIEPVWASEVEPYPIAVTRSRFPNMKHLGSVTDVHGGDIEPVDIITFGSPWAIVDREYCLVRKASNGNPAFFERYGKEWIAYRQKPEEGTV